MIRRPPRSTPLYSSAASDVYKRQVSGLEVLDDLRSDKRFQNLTIVAYTAYATADDIAHLKNRGFDAVLIKPLTSRDLLGILRDHKLIPPSD